MADLLLIFLGAVLVVTFVLNAAIRLKQSQTPAPADTDGELFRQTTRSWGGADFFGAAGVTMISFIAPAVVLVASLPDARATRLAHAFHFTLNWRVAVPVMTIALGLNLLIIRFRHKALLDWLWAAVAAATILCGSSSVWYLLMPR